MPRRHTHAHMMMGDCEECGGDDGEEPDEDSNAYFSYVSAEQFDTVEDQIEQDVVAAFLAA